MRPTRGKTARRLHALSLAVLLGSIVPAVALPSEALAAGKDETLAAGLKKFDDGRKAFEGGQFEEALGDFKASLELLPSPNTRLYMGRCYRAMGKPASAYTAFKLAARESQDRLTASGEKRYAATRDTATQEGAELEAKVPRLLVTVPSNAPAGFAVKVDDKDLPQAAWGVATETDPGSIVIEATGPRLLPFKKTITLKEGGQERVDIPLQHIPTASIVVKLSTLPGGLYLTLDDKPLDITGADKPHEVDVGPHTLVANAPGFLPFTWQKNLVDTEAGVAEVVLKPDPHAGGSFGTPKWMFFTVAGVAVASFAAATGVALSAESQQSAQKALDAYARDPNVKSSIQTQATVTDVLFIAGGVFAAGGVLLAFTTRWKSTDAAPATQPAALSVSPWFSASGGGVGAHGSF